ncbi:HK97 family phage prohead protease [Rhodoplanes serenus]|uniref:HK97 family phage prohead protease n=1 Tax=Rhodoplanes serenus TaxID=200615 RepID=A0A9X5AR91_9BRAD|nr:HK97 family phage prohead protease [Rhodoplanes serenus]MTW16097.1 HK97 family phage prohead protease [Rhodoplanes serenus]
MLLKNHSDVSATRVSPLAEFKLAQGDAGVFTGHASVFGNVDSYGDVVERGAFADTLVQHRSEGAMPPLLWSHDPREPIGRILDLREDAVGLFLRAQLNLDSERGREAHAHVRAGDVGGLSIGFRVNPGGRIKNPDGTTSLRSIQLDEISVVALPANRRARIAAAKSLGSMAELERGLRGEVPLALPRGAAAKIAAAGWPALVGGGEPETHLLDLDQLATRMDSALGDLRNLKGLFR